MGQVVFQCLQRRVEHWNQESLHFAYRRWNARMHTSLAMILNLKIAVLARFAFFTLLDKSSSSSCCLACMPEHAAHRETRRRPSGARHETAAESVTPTPPRAV